MGRCREQYSRPFPAQYLCVYLIPCMASGPTPFQSFALPPSSAAARVSGAAAAQREVWEVQVWGLQNQPIPCVGSVGEMQSCRAQFCSVTSQFLFVVAGVGWSWGHPAGDCHLLTHLGDVSGQTPVGMPYC